MNNQKYAISDFPYPTSSDIQLQVISDLIDSPDMLMEARRILKGEMFTDTNCREAWDLLCLMEDKHQIIDLASVHSVLDNDFVTNKLIPASAGCGGTISVINHCNILATIFIRQEAYQFGVEMLKMATNKSTPVDELITLPDNFINKIRIDLNSDSISISQAINEVAEHIEETQKANLEGKSTRVPTGFSNLDWMTYGGFNEGQLIIVAARPSVGKTAVMLHMAKAASKSGIPSMVFSLEMTNQELAQRLLLSTGMITPLQIASGEMPWTDFENAAGQFDSQPLFLNDSVRTIDEICSRIILNHQYNKCGIAFIDYLGLFDTRSEGKTPLYQVIAGITRRLKQVAKDCRIPVVLLCQLNRASVSENRPPALYDLRDSGSIEQDADIVLMLERPLILDFTHNGNTSLNMWIRKNRQGKAGDYKIVLEPNSTYTSFTDLGVGKQDL